MRHLPLSELLVQRRSRLLRLAFSVLIQGHTKTHALKEAELLADTDLLHRSFSVLIQGHKNMSYIIHRHAPKEAAQPASSSASSAYVSIRQPTSCLVGSAASRSQLPRIATAACLCLRMLTYAYVRMLTYAYVCLRPQPAAASCLVQPPQPAYQLGGCLVGSAAS